MKYIKFIVLAYYCAISPIAAASPALSASAKDAPYQGCVAVAKQEYDAAKKQRLLNTRFNRYVRTGRVGQRYYWYCRS